MTQQVPALPDYKIGQAAAHVVERLQVLVPKAPPKIRHSLSLYMDMFIPLLEYIGEHNPTDTELCTDEGSGAPIELLMPNTCFHAGLLPNHVNKLMKCSFWSDSVKQEPIVHLLSKSTPQRCQIRSLSHIVYKYSSQHTDVYEFVFKCFKCSMLGVYDGVTRPDFKTRQELFHTFKHFKRHSFLEWMKRGHQQLLFFTMKEYLVFAARSLPALRAELVDRYNWDNFEHTVTEAMNSVREKYCTMEFKGIEAMLVSVNKSQTSLYRIKHPFSHALLQEFEHQDDINFVQVVDQSTEYTELIYQMLIRVPHAPIPFEWLQYFGVSIEQCKELTNIQAQSQTDGNKLALRHFLQKCDSTTRIAVRSMATAYDRHRNVRMFTLPVHLTVSQIRVLRQRHGVPDGDEAPPMGRSLLCLHCKTFKGFIVSQKAGKPNNLFAYGHSKVLINDQTGHIHCGRRCDKVDKKRTTNAEFEADEVTAARERKRLAKEQRKDAQNKMCAQNRLWEVPLLGNILQFYGSLYTVCPQCGSFMKYDPAQMYNGMYCGCCIKDGKPVGDIQCARCGDRQHLGDPIMVLGGDSIYLCRQHYKPWIREATSVLSQETILRGLEEKWKRLQSV